MLDKLQTALDDYFERTGEMPEFVRMNLATRRELIRDVEPLIRREFIPTDPNGHILEGMTFSGIVVKVDSKLNDHEFGMGATN